MQTSDEPVKVEMVCLFCHTSHVKLMTPTQLNEMELREKPIQDILHDWTPEERELAISGTCGACFDHMFDSKPLTKGITS